MGKLGQNRAALIRPTPPYLPKLNEIASNQPENSPNLQDTNEFHPIPSNQGDENSPTIGTFIAPPLLLDATLSARGENRGTRGVEIERRSPEASPRGGEEGPKALEKIWGRESEGEGRKAGR